MVSFVKTLLSAALVLLAVAVVYCDRSYYEVLGVPKSASQSQLKSAYRKLSKQYHPDVSQEPDAKNRFQQISEGKLLSNSLPGA
jgi:DnaJ-domain-containing protein 1